MFTLTTMSILVPYPTTPVFSILSSRVSARGLDCVFPPDSFLRCSACVNPLLNGRYSQEVARIVPWSAPVATASEEVPLAFPPAAVGSSTAYGGQVSRDLFLVQHLFTGHVWLLILLSILPLDLDTWTCSWG